MVAMIKKEVNLGKQFEFDVAKFFAFLFMVIIHVSDILSVLDTNIVSKSFFHFLIEFLGGPLSAPVFMFAMGVGMAYTRHNSPKDFAHRGVKLLLMGYALNFFRDTIFVIIVNVLNMQVELPRDFISSFAGVDILQFAGMAFLFMALMKKASLTIGMMLGGAFFIQAFGTLFTGLFHSYPVTLQYILGLLFYINPLTSFPATLWLVYPVLGFGFAYLLRRANDKYNFYKIVLCISTILLVCVTVGSSALGIEIINYFTRDSYYQQNFLSSLWSASIVGIAISLYYYLSYLIKGRLKNAIIYVSRNINALYITQWLLIAYSFAAKELLELPNIVPGWIVPIGVLISIISILIICGWNRIIRMFRIQDKR